MVKRVLLDGSLCHLSGGLNKEAFIEAIKCHFSIDEVEVVHYPFISGKQIVNKLLMYNHMGVFNQHWDYAFVDLTYQNNAMMKDYMGKLKQVSSNIWFIQSGEKWMTDETMLEIFKEHPEYLKYSKEQEVRHYIHFQECFESKFLVYSHILKKCLLDWNDDSQLNPSQIPFEHDLKDMRYAEFNESTLFDLQKREEKWQRPFTAGAHTLDCLISDKFTATIKGKFNEIYLERYSDFLDMERDIILCVNGNEVCHLEKRNASYFLINMNAHVKLDDGITIDGDNSIELRLSDKSNCDFMLFGKLIAII